jgi:hypothetical protein
MILETESTWLLGRCSHQLRKRCVATIMAYSRTQRVFMLENCFSPELYAGVFEAFINAYPDKQVLNKTTINRLITEFRDTENICYRKHVRSRTVFAVVMIDHVVVKVTF